MKWSCLLLVTYLYSTRATFFLTQCECPTFEFSPKIDEFFSKLTSNGIGLECPVGASRGIIRDYQSNQLPEMEFTVDPIFFAEDGASVDPLINWVFVLELDLTNSEENQKYSLFDIGLSIPLSSTIETKVENGARTVDMEISVGGSIKTMSIQDINSIEQVFVIVSLVLNNNAKLLSYGISGSLANENSYQLESANFEVPQAPVPVLIVNPDDSNGGKLFIKNLIFERNNEAIGTSAILLLPSQGNTVVNGVADLSVPPMPVSIANAKLTTNEDTDIESGDLNTFLTASTIDLKYEIVDDSSLRGEISGFDENTGIFDTYTPAENDFGNDVFSFKYSPASESFPYTCELTAADVLIEISSVEDEPTIEVVGDQESVGFVDTVIAVVVAKSVDFPAFDNILQEGFVIIKTLPNGVLKSSDCSTTLAVDDSVSLISGKFEFCFQGVSIEGESDSFTYNVRPASDNAQLEVGPGTIKINGKSPISPASDAAKRSITILEDSASNEISVVASTFADLDALTPADFAFALVIKSLPNASVGILTDISGEALQVNSEIIKDGKFFLKPATDFFNANANAGITNENNEIVFPQDCNDDEKVNSVCPATFSYSMKFGVENTLKETPTEDFGVIVRAVNDKNPEIANVPDEPISLIFIENDAIAKLSTNVESIEVSNDNGIEIFNIGIRFVGEGGADIQNRESQTGDPEVIGFESVNDADAGTNGGVCISEGCPVLQVVGLPSQINDFLGDLTFSIPNEATTNGAISITLAGNGETFDTDGGSFNFSIVTSSPTTSPTKLPTVSPTPGSTNIIDEFGIEVVGGAAAGVFVFVLLCLFCIFCVFCKRSSSEKETLFDEEDIKKQDDTAKEVEEDQV